MKQSLSKKRMKKRERKKEKEKNIEVRRTWKEVVKREMADKKSESKGRRET